MNRCPECRGPLTIITRFVAGRRRRVWWCSRCEETRGKPLPEGAPYHQAKGV